jgi:hypothetical protein
VSPLESASAGAIAAPDENSPRGVTACTVAFSMELPTLTIEFFVSAAAFAGFASCHRRRVIQTTAVDGPKKRVSVDSR